MIAAPDPHDQVTLTLCKSLAFRHGLTLRESLARRLVVQRLVGAGQAVDAIVGVTRATGEIAGASEDAVVSLASILPPRALAPGLAAASSVAARAVAWAGSGQETGHTDLR